MCKWRFLGDLLNVCVFFFQVILILTKLFDFNLGTVTESSLWRSVDFGTTYEKLTDKVMIRTMLSYLYVCPTNKRKVSVFLCIRDTDVLNCQIENI
ncbi:hypothetical protein cypCar_00010748 [Cyprinus carpio]|nr:hypothetical protein cypCar_00010748 [Cyprinus carpio]